MNEKDWLDTATRKIRFRPDRKAVRRELEAHLEDLREASGLDEDAALKAMGDPAALAEELGRIHRPWLGYLWRMSQIALIGAAALYCVMLIMLAVSPGRTWLLPSERISAYRHWQGSQAGTAPYIVLEEREFPSDVTIQTGGYTIDIDRVILRKEDYPEKPDPRWTLYVDLDVGLSRWEEPLHLWYAASGARTSEGETRAFWSLSSCLGFRQKAMLVFEDLAEDTEWVELDLGHGELRRTLRFDLSEEAET
ncbi:MAG: hypothetical protein HDT20_06865 [Oscillibacter sp.]|nr:hypothetical protein [Oscillibacter sp.]